MLFRITFSEGIARAKQGRRSVCQCLLVGLCWAMGVGIPSPLRAQTGKAASVEKQVPELSPWGKKMAAMGLKNIAEADPTLVIDLMYRRADNFTGRILYADLAEAFLHPEALEGLLRAHRALKAAHPHYRLIVYDAARPMPVQQKMWNVVRNTSKQRYVSNPARGGGLHNYGLAVDISIVDAQGRPLPMGTPVDHLGKEAHITAEAELVKQGKLTPAERKNRQLLRRVMQAGGFKPLPNEWWHFNFRSRAEARQHYRLIGE